MIIIPKEKEESTIRYSNGYKIRQDDIRGTCMYKRRVACDDEGNCRFEKIEIFPEYSLLIKDCSYGKTDKISYSRKIDIDKSMYTMIDMKTGTRLQWGADTVAPNTEDSKLQKFMSGIMYENFASDFTYLLDDDIIYKSDKICDISPVDMLQLKNKIYIEEDTLQIGYTKFIGLLSSWFTQWTFNYPFDSYVIIDTKSGTYNIPEFKYLGVIEKDYAKKIYKSYLESLSELTKLIKYNCDKEGRRLRIYVFTSSYSTIIRIKDIDHKGFVFDKNLNASDHFPSIICNFVSDGFKFNISEEMYNIVNTDNGEVTEDMVESYIEDSNVDI